MSKKDEFLLIQEREYKKCIEDKFPQWHYSGIQIEIVKIVDKYFSIAPYCNGQISLAAEDNIRPLDGVTHCYSLDK